ncbi:CPSF A subunit region [Oesophagostomum dentatum]|uniref:CPSF A subunit region n=1 Tax=Oesophagostomum dentatum TaxID=61180 RepID=A0A0B1T1W9_OESDE|nr:CPSF A subunit region [Oesophagostomum dentatum]
MQADPANRCGAVVIYDRVLGILPFDGDYINSFSIPLSEIDHRLENIVDMVFLDGYYEPTLLFLYEPHQTTAGRASVRYDTMHLLGVSVNVFDEQVAVVWQVGSLPMDCNRLLPIPKPLGGVLVIGSNEDLKHLSMTLDAGPAEWIGNNHVALGTMDGKLFILTLVTDSSETVRSLDLEFAFDTSIAYCMNLCSPGRLFIGSRLGDSQLLEFSIEKEEQKEEAPPEPKKSRVEEAIKPDEEDLELYGEQIIEQVDLKHLSMTLDAGPAEWIGNNHVALGTMDGKLFILTLVTDSSETVRSLDLEYAFEEEAPPEPKKSRVEEAIKPDEEDLELYGEQIIEQVATVEAKVKEKLIFRELDRLTNIGPIKSITAGGAHGISPILLEQERVDPIFDIVAASGHTVNGSICVLQRTVRPDIITSSFLQDAQQLWAVGRREDDSHKYLIVSRTRSSLILELGEDMVELEEPLFLSDEPTVAAGELADGGLAVQVTSLRVALVAEEKQLQQIDLDSNFPVVAASIVDPYVALLTQNGRLMLFHLVLNPTVHLQEIDISNTPFTEKTIHHRAPLTALSIYRDMSGIMVCARDADDIGFVAGRLGKKSSARRSVVDSVDLDLYGEDALPTTTTTVDEDDLLYGDTAGEKRGDGIRKRKRMAEISSVATGCEESDAIDPNTVEPTYWLILARDSGKVVIHSLPDMSVVYQFLKFGLMPELVTDLMPEEEEKDRKEQEARAEQFENSSMQFRPNERVVELQIVGMGINQGHPTLMAVIDDQVIAYEVYKWRNPLREHLAVGFRRLSMTVTIRSTPFMGQDGRRAEVEVGREIEQHRVIIHPFERVCGIMNGVMLSGAYPCLVLVGAWGGLQCHPLTIDGPLSAFTPFNNQNVPNGFLYIAKNLQELRIARLQTDYDYELPFPCKKVPVGATVHYVRYMMSSQVYAVTTSVPTKSNKIWVVVNDDKQVETHEKNENFVLPSIPQYSLNLYSPVDWKPVPNTDIKFEEMEVVTACEEVTLRSESTISGMQPYLAVGTINNYGEEVLVRGRIILAEIIDVVPEPGKPTSKHKIKVVYDKEQKGPVTALAAINGLLLSGMAQKGARGGKPIRPLINATNTKNMVDGELVEQFMHLSTSRKQDLARSLGASRYHIMDDLVQIQRLSTFY